MDQGSTREGSVVHNFALTVTKFCVMWEGLALPHDTKFCNCRGEIVDKKVIFTWSLIHGLSWSGLIKADPDVFPSIYISLILIIQSHTVRDILLLLQHVCLPKWILSYSETSLCCRTFVMGVTLHGGHWSLLVQLMTYATSHYLNQW